MKVTTKLLSHLDIETETSLKEIAPNSCQNCGLLPNESIDSNGLFMKRWSCSTSGKILPCISSVTDSTSSSCNPINNNNSSNEMTSFTTGVKRTKNRHRRSCKEGKSLMPPLGFFWDIENCPVPKCKSGVTVVFKLREFFLRNYREMEFVVACDVKKEAPRLIHELHDAQVNLIHVESISKNAADDKLRQSIRRFADIHGSPACIVLISSDINFAADLTALRFREHIHVILVRNVAASAALISCANESYLYTEIVDEIPLKDTWRCEENNDFFYIEVKNLPILSPALIKTRLQFLTNNCGGKVVNIIADKGVAYLRFSNQMSACRAKLRIQGEDVYGQKIQVVTRGYHNYPGENVKLNDNSNHESSTTGTQKCSTFRRQQNSTVAANLMGLRRNYTAQSSRDNFPTVATNKNSSSDVSEGFSVHNSSTSGSSAASINLVVSNLDYTIRYSKLRKLLSEMLENYVSKININFNMENDGGHTAVIKTQTPQEAKLVFSRLHRQKLGNKTIVCSYEQINSPQPEQLKAIIVAVLTAAPEKKMPWHTFIELLKKSYKFTVSISEVHKLKDVCRVSDVKDARIISLNEDLALFRLYSPNLYQNLVPYCIQHCAQSWHLYELNAVFIHCVNTPLTSFTAKLNHLLSTHQGSLPLLSFKICYEYEFQTALPIDVKSGVPLEHLITCVPNVSIQTGGPKKNIKFIKKCEENNGQNCRQLINQKGVIEDGAYSKSLTSDVSRFCRELVDLLKNSERCQIPLSKIIPAYYQLFCRQINVSDYGHRKLVDLLESIPHVVQILGEGEHRLVTLCHAAQMRRFSLDLWRVVKNQPYKEIVETDFASAYEKLFGKQFSAVEYGLCSFGDLLAKLSENSVKVDVNVEGDKASSGKMNELPKPPQTAQEVERTREFVSELIDILRHAPNCTMLFNKFVPAYHNYFGRQCKVSDYGFRKLIELFETIPDVVKIEKLPIGDRVIRLTMRETRKILGEQLRNLISYSAPNMEFGIRIGDLCGAFHRQYGYPLKTDVYEAKNLLDLIKQLWDYIRLVENDEGVVVITADTDTLQKETVRCWSLLVKPPYCLELNAFLYEYSVRYKGPASIEMLKNLKDVIQISTVNTTEYIVLTGLYMFAAQLYWLLFNNHGSIVISALPILYEQKYAKQLDLKQYKMMSVKDLRKKFQFLLLPYSIYKKDTIHLNMSLADFKVALPPVLNKLYSAIRGGSPAFQQLQKNLEVRQKLSIPDTTPTLLSPSSFCNADMNTTFTDDDMSLYINLPIASPPFKNDYCNFDSLSPKMQAIEQSCTIHNNTDYNSLSQIWDPSPYPSTLPLPHNLFSSMASDESYIKDSDVNSTLAISPFEPYE